MRKHKTTDFICAREEFGKGLKASKNDSELFSLKTSICGGMHIYELWIEQRRFDLREKSARHSLA